MNGFEKHGIGHLSASSINLWANAPDVWVARYLHGMKSNFGPAPRRGQCVEDAVADALNGKALAEGIAAAEEKFDRTFLIGDEATTKERALIAPMAEIALAELEGYGKPDDIPSDKHQHKIEIKADFGDWSIPIIGYLDFKFSGHGLVVDLKTTTRVPSVMSADHQLQRAIYAKASGNAAVKFLYVSAKKASWLEDGDPAEVLARAKMQIARLERFLTQLDADTALDCVPHNPNTIFWRGDEAARHQFFGT